MDTLIGKASLTKNQIENLKNLDLDFIKGVSYWDDGKIIAVSESDLSDEQKAIVLQKINALPDVIDVSNKAEHRHELNSVIESLGLTKDQFKKLIRVIKREISA